MLDIRFGAHIKHLPQASSRPQRHQQMFLSAERSPLSDGFESTTRRLRAHRATPKMSQVHGLWTCSLVGTEPAFKLVLSNVHLRCSILGPNFSKHCAPWKPIWRRGRPLCGHRTGVLNGTPNQSKNKNKKDNNTKPKELNNKMNKSEEEKNTLTSWINTNRGWRTGSQTLLRKCCPKSNIKLNKNNHTREQQ